MERQEGTGDAQRVERRTEEVQGGLDTHLPRGSGHAHALPGLFGTGLEARPVVATGEEVPGSDRAGQRGRGWGKPNPMVGRSGLLGGNVWEGQRGRGGQGSWSQGCGRTPAGPREGRAG